MKPRPLRLLPLLFGVLAALLLALLLALLSPSTLVGGLRAPMRRFRRRWLGGRLSVTVEVVCPNRSISVGVRPGLSEYIPGIAGREAEFVLIRWLRRLRVLELLSADLGDCPPGTVALAATLGVLRNAKNSFWLDDLELVPERFVTGVVPADCEEGALGVPC